ncbi:hypothetical protein PFISCL1PPCAC_10000, partial [Pristionchus fissidentatus]
RASLHHVARPVAVFREVFKTKIFFDDKPSMTTVSYRHGGKPAVAGHPTITSSLIQSLQMLVQSIDVNYR